MRTRLKKSLSFVMLCSMLLFTGCGEQPKDVTEHARVPEVTGNMDISILDVGKADCIVIQTENYNMMIDTAEKNNADDIEEFLAANNITRIDYLELTHYDKDHIGGLKKLLKNGLEVGHIYAYDNEATSGTYMDMMEALEEHGLSLDYVKDTVELTLDDVLIEIYPPLKDSYVSADTQPGDEIENEFSLVTKITHGDNRFLFTGDACNGRLQELSSQLNVDVDFLKVPHHGNGDNNTNSFVQKVSAEYAVITCSNKNMPDQAVVDALEKTGAKVYETRNGQVDCSSDGKIISVTQLPPK